MFSNSNGVLRKFLKTSHGFIAGLTTAAVITPSCTKYEQICSLSGSHSSSIRGHEEEVTSLGNRRQVSFSFEAGSAVPLNINIIHAPMRCRPNN